MCLLADILCTPPRLQLQSIEHTTDGHLSVAVVYELRDEAPVQSPISVDADPKSFPVWRGKESTDSAKVSHLICYQSKCDGGTLLVQLEGNEGLIASPKVGMPP